jgi:hypothetical protein
MGMCSEICFLQVAESLNHLKSFTQFSAHHVSHTAGTLKQAQKHAWCHTAKSHPSFLPNSPLIHTQAASS